jgi:hypothetical protein
MKNEMTMTEIRRHFEQRRRRVEKLKADEAKLKKVVTLMIQIN